MNKTLKLIIQGKVQGVGYRRWFEQQALELELKGYVRNLHSGEVEAVIVGQIDLLQDMIARSYMGPARAEVFQIIQMEVEQDQDFVVFEMLR